MSELLDELHNQLFDITYDIVKKCEENNIEYCLAWGSALGAVRHSNIIPWDDDVDMYISYKDYKKLKQIYINENSEYFYQDVETNPEYYLFFSKIRKENTTSMTIADKNMNISWGICVDLFPIFEYDKPQLSKWTKIKINILRRIAYLPYYKFKGNKIGSLLYSIVGEKRRQKMFFSILDGIEKKGEYCMDLEDNNLEPFIMKKKDIFPGAKKKFGDINVNVPTDYDSYLRKAYGDNYMEIPKEGSKFRYAHDGIIVDCNKSYKEYK